MLLSNNQSKRRVKRSASEKASLILSYRQSGKSMGSFCKENKLAPSSFRGWLGKDCEITLAEEDGCGERVPKSCFVELEPDGKRLIEEDPSCGQVLKLRLGKAITLELSWRE